MKRIFVFTMLTLALALGAYAQGSSDGRKQWMNEMQQYKRSFFSKELGLSASQQAKFFALYEAMDEENRKMTDDIRTMEQRLQKADNATDLEYEKATEAIYDTRVRQAELERSYVAKFREVLTPRQLFRLNGVERDFQRDVLRNHRRLHVKKPHNGAKEGTNNDR